MQTLPQVAIVGRPNVGKSAVFNRLIGRRVAIVHDQAGITRDRLAAKSTLTKIACECIDTGGIGQALDDGFEQAVRAEVDIALSTATMILFVVDTKEGLTPIENEIAKLLYQTKVPVLLIANKVDHENQESAAQDFARLGFGDYIAVSAEHGRGFTDLIEKIDNQLIKLGYKDETEEAEQVKEANKRSLKISLIGKPNVGKSSIANAILGENRAIVSDVAGTTRDAVDMDFDYQFQPYKLIDTAGLRSRSKMTESVEVFSAMRTQKAIRRSDICCLVIDAGQGVSAMDRKIAKIIQEERKPCLIILNKFDLYHPDAPKSVRLEHLTEEVRSELFFLHYADFVAVSALKNESIGKIFGQIQLIRKHAQNVITTGVLNRLIEKALLRNPPARHRKYKKALKIFYATVALQERYEQIPVPLYIVFINDKRLWSESYEHYLANYLRKEYDNPSIPIVFSVRAKERY